MCNFSTMHYTGQKIHSWGAFAKNFHIPIYFTKYSNFKWQTTSTTVITFSLRLRLKAHKDLFAYFSQWKIFLSFLVFLKWFGHSLVNMIMIKSGKKLRNWSFTGNYDHDQLRKKTKKRKYKNQLPTISIKLWSKNFTYRPKDKQTNTTTHAQWTSEIDK